MKILAELKIIIPLLLLCTGVLILPQFLRPDTYGMIGDTSYYYLRIAQHPFTPEDPLSYGGRINTIQVYPLLISVFSGVFNIPLSAAILILSFLITLGILFTFYLILRKLQYSRIFAAGAAFIAALAPPLIRFANTPNTYALSLFLILLAYLAHLFKQRTLSTVPLLLIPFLGITHTLIALFCLIILAIHEKVIPLVRIILLCALSLIPLLAYGIPTIPPTVGEVTFISLFFSEFGAVLSASIFLILLAFFGLRMLWHEKYTHLTFYLLLFGIIAITLLYSAYLPYVVLPLAFLAALGTRSLITKPWESPILQHIILGLLLLGLVFSTLLSYPVIALAEPHPDTFAAFAHLQEDTTSPEIVIISHPDNGNWISSIGNRTNIMDTEYAFAPNIHDRWNDTQTLFATKDITEAERIIRKYDIDYIYIDKDMRNGQVWNDTSQGLLFLFEASTKFSLYYQGSEVELWRVKLQ